MCQLLADYEPFTFSNHLPFCHLEPHWKIIFHVFRALLQAPSDKTRSRELRNYVVEERSPWLVHCCIPKKSRTHTWVRSDSLRLHLHVLFYLAHFFAIFHYLVFLQRQLNIILSTVSRAHTSIHPHAYIPNAMERSFALSNTLTLLNPHVVSTTFTSGSISAHLRNTRGGFQDC